MAFKFDTDDTRGQALQSDALLENTSSNPYFKASTNAKLNKAFKTTTKHTVGAVNEVFDALNNLILKVNENIESTKTLLKTSTEDANDLATLEGTFIHAVMSTKKSVDAINEAIEKGTIGGGATSPASGSIFNDEPSVTSNSQVAFVLTKTPKDTANILFFINGIKYSQKNWTYDKDSNTITWTSIKSNTTVKGFDIAMSDEITAVYMA